MTREVIVLPEAERDILDIDTWLTLNRSVATADEVLGKLEARVLSLDTMAERGRIPPELDRLAVRTYREVVEGTYRILYAVEGEKVLVHAVLEGRRDMASLLLSRILR